MQCHVIIRQSRDCFWQHGHLDNIDDVENVDAVWNLDNITDWDGIGNIDMATLMMWMMLTTSTTLTI